MKRVKLIIAYDGTNYCGWQIQSNGITVEEVLNKALTALLKEPIVVIGASRTDSGVHAEGNVAVFDTDSRMPADKICFALNQRLPDDVRVLHSEEVGPLWHPRRQNCIKTYEYRILNRKIAIPTLRLYTHFYYVPLDVEKMKEAAKYLVGEHDFKSFCTIHSQIEETVRIIYSLDVEQTGDVITIRVSGSGFLYNMVRIIAGTLIKVGMGAYPPEHVEEIIDARDRQKAGPKVPAKGLSLISLEYEKELEPVIVGENKEWKYSLIQSEVLPKKKAYLLIERCVEADYDRLLTRVTHQAVRNGAQMVYVCDKEQEGRIVPGKQYGYYSFQHAHDMVKMTRGVSDEKETFKSVSDITLEPLTEPGILEFCQLYNETFYRVSNSSTMTESELRDRLANEEELLFGVKREGQALGFVMLIKRDSELEIDSIGICEEFRKQGLAECVFTKVEELAVMLGRKELSLLVVDSNKPAFSLYQKLGFQIVELKSRWYQAHA